ncbi:hypothetical protein EUZ95_02435 [Enterococcus durans]|nr:hypothetical protein EUZ95_02435 [Enterococcus durans]
MSRTQLTQKYPSPYFKENCLTKEIHKKQLCLIYKEVFIYRKPFQQDRQRLGQKCLTPRNKKKFTKIAFQIFVNFSLFPKELLLPPPFIRF